jgi:pimeloyl-ACP methyl ester carboxylesterase
MLYKTLKRPFFGAFMVKWRNPIPESERDDWQEVSTTSKSGGRIVGLFRRTQAAAPKATIVLGHPMGKEAKGYFIKHGYTDLLLQNGFHVLVFDINGFGESSHGNFSYYDDILAIGLEAQRLTPELPIGYHGISLGGQWAVMTFADDVHPYRFAVVESAATSLDEFWRRFPSAHRVLRFLNFFMPRYAHQIKPIERIAEAKHLHSILWIYSETDDWTPLDMGRRLHARCRIPSELWTVPDAEHAAIMKSAHKVAYEKKLLAYFHQHLNPA